jgi:putative phosphoribosyl transferase
VAIFADRTDAGRQLAEALRTLDDPAAIVFGIPRGGVVVAAEVARALGLPLAAVVVRKLGAPAHEEYAIGAIAEDAEVVDETAVRHTGVTAAQLAAVEGRERAELLRRTRLFAAVPAVPRGRTALVVDDGIATGSTATAACRSLKARGAARVVLAVPVAPTAWRPDPGVVDQYVCPHAIEDFWAVGQFYRDFTQTTDEEVTRALAADLPVDDASAEG